MLESAETRWRMGIIRKWDTPELQNQRPPASLWVAILNGKPYIPPAGDLKKPKVHARVNHGVWQLVCPVCGSAQHAAVSDPWFYCGQCMNRAFGNRRLPVVLPDDAARISDRLHMRPDARFRNWHPGETIADLQRQDEDAIRRGLHRVVEHG